MKQLEEIIDWLESDPLNAFKVTNMDDLETLGGDCNLTAQYLNGRHGSVAGFFESIFQQGVTKVRIQERRKSGNAFVKAGEPFTFEFMSAEPANASAEVKTNLPVNDQMTRPIIPALGMPGLGQAQQIYQYMDHTRLQGENAELKSENKRLSEKLDELKEKVLRNEILEGKTVGVRESQTKLIEAYAPLAGPLIAVLTEKLTGAPVPSNAPVASLTGSDLSETHRDVFTILSDLDQNQVYFIGRLAESINKPEISAAFYEFLTVNNLAEN